VDNFEGFKTSGEEVTVDLVVTAKVELGLGSEEVAELLQSHDKILMGEELLLLDRQRKWFLEKESTPGKKYGERC
jgi:hypothetical protein